jgi:hypothetical protein
MLAVASAVVVALAPTVAHAATVGDTYLALGDSIAYGFNQAQATAQGSNPVPSSFHGFDYYFGQALRLANPKLTVINDGCPGETTLSFVNGSGTPGYCAGTEGHPPVPYSSLHHPYTASSQLGDALAILAADHNVSPITLDLGNNDVAGFLLGTCGMPTANKCTSAQIATGLGQIATSIGSILHLLRAAAPNAQMILVGLYNPDPVLLPSPGGDAFVAEFNSDLAAAAASVTNTSFANPEPLFNPAGFLGSSPLDEIGDIPSICLLTNQCASGLYDPLSAKADSHPTMLGYETLAGLVETAFLTH